MSTSAKTVRLRVDDLRGIAQLATAATTGALRITEGVHQSVWRTLGAPRGPGQGRTRGITGLVYRSVERITELVGTGADTVLARLQPLLEPPTPAEAASTSSREAFLAALNGLMGDRLVASGNPLALPMSLRCGGFPVDGAALVPRATATPKVLLLVHGLGMNDGHWRTLRAGRPVDHGDALGERLGYTPVYLRYNSGLHISQNGRQLATQLEHMLQRWPLPVEELAVVAHSMGGLVTRSAVYYAEQAGYAWPRRLKSIVFLGTPHHGAPLERVGNWIDVILRAAPYTAPFARLGELRSAGVTDLRHGHVLDEDWHGRDRFRRARDTRRHVPLPEHVACHAIAATMAARRSALADRVIGDGLVPLCSALGQHEDRQRRLNFAPDSQWIFYRTNHLALLSSPDVTLKMHEWLTRSASHGMRS